MSKIDSSKMMQALTKNQNNEQKQQSNGDFNLKTEQVVNKLFEALKVIFPAHGLAFNDLKTFEQTKASWIKAFLKAQLTEQEIRRGVENMRLSDRPFFPSSGQFIAACKPTASELGAPELADAYSQACSIAHQPDSLYRLPPAVYDALRAVTLANIKTLDEKQLKPLFAQHYQAALDKLANGVQLQPAPKPLPKPEHKPASEATRKQKLNKLKAMLNG